MTSSDIHAAISSAVAGRQLLDHPFYRQWQEGTLTTSDLAGYAGQYRHFEAALPAALRAVTGSLPEGRARDLVAANLADETANPRPHVELFESFAAAVEAPDQAAATPATQNLVDLYHDAVAAGPVAALSVVAAYETQAAVIASTKAGSLGTHYGLDDRAVEFWSVHAVMEAEHGEWTTDALSELAATPETVGDWATRSAQAWWAFLDDRAAACV